MPSYLRQSSSGRTILVRPMGWVKSMTGIGQVEVGKYYCLDLTDSISDSVDYISAISDELYINYESYRSRPFMRKSHPPGRLSHPLFGCCTVATEALCFLLPERLSPKPYKATDDDGIEHWWCQTICPSTGDAVIHDATAGQFDVVSFSPPYAEGKKTALMGWQRSPSKRTLDLIGKVAPSSLRFRCDKQDYLPESHSVYTAPGTLDEFLI